MFGFFSFVYFSRCTHILNGRLIIELLWKFPKVSLVAGLRTPWPETNWSCLLCCASRPATMFPSSNMGPTAMTGSSSTAWPTEKVSSLPWMSCYYMYQSCWCFFDSAVHFVQGKEMASTSQRFMPALRLAHTWQCLLQSWLLRCPGAWRVWPNVSFVTPTCTCIRIQACVSIADRNLHSTGKSLNSLLCSMQGTIT